MDRFEHIKLQPIVMSDCAGEKHEFHFQIRLLGHVMALEAFELKAGALGGYQFQIIGEPDDDPLSLLANLVERMRGIWSVRYLVSDADGANTAERAVSGGIEWDASADSRVPQLVIDGQDVSWAEFGRILMNFEGWQFRLSIHDRSDEA